MNHLIHKGRDWCQLLCILTLALLVGSGISVAVRLLTPALIQLRTAPISAAKADLGLVRSAPEGKEADQQRA